MSQLLNLPKESYYLPGSAIFNKARRKFSYTRCLS